jgi:pSer/pThr/pTyr-binding forkhead associated (FHA) protein
MTLYARLVAPTGETVREFAVTTFPVRIGRDPAAEIAVNDHQFPVVSGLHAEINRISGSLVLAARSSKNMTLHNDQPVVEPVPLRAGDRVRLGVTGPTVEIIRVGAVDTDAEPVAPASVPRRRRPIRWRTVGFLVAGLALHLLGAYLALVLFGVVPNPLRSRAGNVPSDSREAGPKEPGPAKQF